MSIEHAPLGRCLVCGAVAPSAQRSLPGLKDERTGLIAQVCSDDCAEIARRFAARRATQLGPSRAGVTVAALGVLAALFFLATGRDLGRALLVLSVFGAGTSRLAYPDALPLAVARRLGIARATELLQWTGVLLCIAAIAVAAAFLLGWPGR